MERAEPVAATSPATERHGQAGSSPDGHRLIECGEEGSAGTRDRESTVRERKDIGKRAVRKVGFDLCGVHSLQSADWCNTKLEVRGHLLSRWGQM